MSRSVVVLFDNPEGKQMIKETCAGNGIVFDVFEELVKVEVEQHGKQRRAGIWDDFDDILDRIQVEEE